MTYCPAGDPDPNPCCSTGDYIFSAFNSMHSFFGIYRIVIVPKSGNPVFGQIDEFDACRLVRWASPRNPSLRFDPGVGLRKLEPDRWQFVFDQFLDGLQRQSTLADIQNDAAVIFT